MTWGQIKKAINSTLGTKDFQPLNEIFSNGIQKLKDAISNGTLICGKSKVLEDNSVELEADQNRIESTLRATHQGIEDGVYIVDYSIAGVWEGRRSTIKRFDVLRVSSVQRDSTTVDYSGTSLTINLTITTEKIIVSASPVYTASSGYSHSELEYAKVKKIF
jgi:hypothetical protein